jgi:prophage antirepressor-like protein
MTIEQYQFGDQKVRVIDRDGEPWWLASDIAAVLELGNVRSSLALLDDDEKGVHSMDTLGGPQSVTIVSESGLYRLIFRSRKPEAVTFRRWVTHEVLPAIRRTGGYNFASAEAVTPIVARLAEIAHKEHVVPASGRVLAHHRWHNTQKGIEAFGQLCEQLELEFPPLPPAINDGHREITSGETD